MQSGLHPMASFMEEAASLAESWRYAACPNPTVGAVLVKDGALVACGVHEAYGEDHAEVACLHDATQKGVNPAECTLVVTLEPCNHHGKTPPCAKAILNAGIRHIVIGVLDPNPQAGGGAVFLREQGVLVETGVCAKRCADLIADFTVWQTTKRPYVILKLASTLDGKVATRDGHSRWVSSEASRREVHRLRARVGSCGGAVLVGGVTFRLDSPQLTARPDDGEPVVRQPLGCAILSRLPSQDVPLVRARPHEALFIVSEAVAASREAAELRQHGVRVLGVPGRADGLDLNAAMIQLREQGCPYVLCEGGGKLALSLLDANLVDEFHLHLAPRILGDASARSLFAGRNVESMDDAVRLRITHVERYGDDCHLILRRALAETAIQIL